MGNNLGFSLIDPYVKNSSEQRIYAFDDFHLDVEHLILSRNGEEIELAPKAVETLIALVERHGKVVSKDELLDIVWPDTIVEESNLFAYLSHLRKALGTRKDGKPYVETLRRRGYRFTGEVNLVAENEQEIALKLARSSAVQQPLRTGPVRLSSNSGQVVVLAEWQREEPRNEDVAVKKSLSPERAMSSSSKKKRFRRLFSIALILVLFLVASVGIFDWRLRTAPIKTLAVLPLKPLIASKRDEVLETGITRALISKLNSGEELSVRPFPAVRRFGSLDQDPLDAGWKVWVDAVLDGNVQVVNDKIVISLVLLRVYDGKQLWAGDFEKPTADILLLQNSISEDIATKLQIPLDARFARDYTKNANAYEQYSNGEFHRLKLILPEATQAIRYYENAIELDQNYTLAYVGLAHTYRALLLSGDQDPTDAIPKAKFAASRAVQLDPEYAEARIVQGNSYFWYEWNWPAAEQEYLKAIALERKNPLTHLSYSHFLSNTGRHNEAIEAVEKGLELDARNPFALAIKGQVLTFAGRHQEALSVLRRATELDEGLWLPHLFLSRLHSVMGEYDAAIREGELARELSGGSAEAASMIANAMAKSEDQNGAQRILEELKARSGARYVPAYPLAGVYNALGDRDKALDMLEKSFEQEDALMVFLGVEPKWDNLRSEPRFIDLMRKMRLE